MSIPTASLPLTHHTEREMNRHQRGLVDTCLEEGQYEAAIAVLAQLCSSKYKPAASHVRQLLFMALYPPQEGVKENTEMEPASPRKAAKQHRSLPFPSPAATAESQQLLASLAITHSPSSLFRALPCYSRNDMRLRDAQNFGDDEEYSVIAREAMCIHESKNCWTILEEGFIRRKKVMYSTPPRNNRGQNINTVADDDDDDDIESPRVVAELAWPVLEWMITLFESDEIEQVNNGLPRHSPILLSQIPSPRSGSGSQWEVDAPLEIALYCLKQTQQKRKQYGARLLTLLINLTSTTHLDQPLFITSVYSRLSSFSADEFSALFPLLPPSPIINRFKVAFCQKYIAFSSANHQPTNSRPKPQTRAQPRIVPSARQRPGQDDDASAKTSSGPASIASKHTPPSAAEILHLLGLRPGHHQDVAAFLRLKFELLSAFVTLQSQMAAEDKDSDWLKALSDGRLKAALDDFRHDDPELGQFYRDISQKMMTIQ